MIRYLAAAFLALAAFAQPAFAQSMWSHADSGISVERSIGEMRLNREQDASGGGGHDVILQFGGGRTAVTLYVDRSAYPNPALWFERTRMAMNTNVGSAQRAADPRSITLGGASAPNGLREDIALSGGPYRATSVAIVQAGQWIVKARISSQSLGVEEVAARMDQLLAALRFERMPAPHPLLVPSPCPEANAMRGSRIARPSQEGVAAASVNGIMALGEARGFPGSFAADPSAWCRETSGIPAEYGTIYRARNGSAWVGLIGDSGRAVAGMRLAVPTGAGAAIFVSTPSSTIVAALYDDLPAPDGAVMDALPIVVGQARGLAEISTDAPRGGDRKR
jgi:hypothetical protein